MKLSVVIPAHNEAASVGDTVTGLHQHLKAVGIEHEIVVVDDHSTDETAAVLAAVEADIPAVRASVTPDPGGFGLAVAHGMAETDGDAIAVYMADASDRPEDLVQFWETLLDTGADCVFGTRFAPASTVRDYPWPKLVLNRLANTFIRLLFGISYNDCTNAFKLYGRRAYEGIQPILSHHFNITVELPPKVITRGYSYEVVPNDWINRSSGRSKLRIKEMGSRYLFIVLYCLIEKWLSRGDYRLGRPGESESVHPSHIEGS